MKPVCKCYTLNSAISTHKNYLFRICTRFMVLKEWTLILFTINMGLRCAMTGSSFVKANQTTL